MKWILLLVFLFMTSSCLSLWPWMFAKTVLESEPERPRIRVVSPPRRTYITRARTKWERQFDRNGDGFLYGDEVLYLKQAQRVRKQEKILMGEK